MPKRSLRLVQRHMKQLKQGGHTGMPVRPGIGAAAMRADLKALRRSRPVVGASP